MTWRSFRKWLAYLSLGGLALVLGIILVNTFRFTEDPSVVPPADPVSFDEQLAARRLAEALRYETVSYQDVTRIDSIAFISLHAYLQQAFPEVHAALQREVVSELSLLYRWTGRDTTQLPVLLMAHSDVVPASPERWVYPPFSGTIKSDTIWGRGALDDKSSMMAFLEAVESLVKNNFQPARTIYIAIGHDEEVGGLNGAAKIADLLRKRGVKFEFVIDEGGFMVEEFIDGLHKPVAAIGIAEKGYLSLEFTAEGQSGHSSVPPRHTSVGQLSRAIVALESNPFPARLQGATRHLILRIGPSLSFSKRLMIANLWLFNPVVEWILGRAPETNALVRTTTAATMFSGSEKENVLPSIARAVVNFRIMPGETREGVINRVVEIIDDPGVHVRPLAGSSEPSPVANIQSPAFKLLEHSIHQIAGSENVIVAPYLVMGATDSRYFQPLSQNIYRYNGAKLNLDLLRGYHGLNERLPLREYSSMIRTFHQIIRNLDMLGH